MADLSICIPVFNFSIADLLALLSSDTITGFKTEIVLIDDASDKRFRDLNRKAAEKYSASYVQLEKNLGRSAIRNLFIKYANTDVLLFLDCDVLPRPGRFIQSYMTALGGKDSVICGGICYADQPEPGRELHWTYGVAREALTADKRAARPYHHFLSGNFLVPKKILQHVPFNEKLTGYGYEDTLFSIELEKNGVEMIHIDSPAEHLRLDTAEAFMTKTENALQNLLTLYCTKDYESLLPRYIRLIKVFRLLKFPGLRNLVYRLYQLSGQRIRRQMISGSTNLRRLDIYKLLFFTALERNNTKPY